MPHRHRSPRRKDRTALLRQVAALLAAFAAFALGGPATAQSTFIAFHSPQANGQALGSKPNPPALAVNVGGNATLNLYVENFDPAGATASGVDPNGKPRACVDGAGDEMCGWLLELVGRGVRIDSFADAEGGEGGIVSMFGANGTSLKVTGGSADGQLGPVAVGTLGITVLSANASLELVGGSWVDAAAVLRQPSVQVLAVSVDTCGNSTREAPEECDDGNASAGDGCFPSCRLEDGFALSGTAQGGTIDLSLGEKSGPLVATTIPGEAADVVAARMALLIEDDAEIAAAARSAERVPDSTVVTDATLLAAASTDPGLQLTLLPEPSSGVSLLAGAFAVSALARRRRRIRRGGGSD